MAPDRPTADRRHWHRLSIDLEILVHARDGHEDRLLGTAWSERGVFLRTRHPFPIGTLVELSVALPGHHQRIAWPAIVVRIEDHEAPGEPHGMGLRFSALPAPVTHHLDEALRRRAILEPTVELVTVPTIAVVAPPGMRRQELGRVLGPSFDVVVADDLEGLARLAEHGVAPDVVVVAVAPQTRTLADFLERRLAAAARAPRLVVALGAVPAGFDRTIEEPVLALPPDTRPAQVRALVTAFVSPAHVLAAAAAAAAAAAKAEEPEGSDVELELEVEAASVATPRAG
jgi:hypothetical protein